MKKLLLMSVVLGALLSQANAIPSLKIIANKLVGGVRFVIYENCGWPGVSAYWRPPTNLASCQLWTPSRPAWVGYTPICGWTGPFSTRCRYFVCKIPDLSPTTDFYVKTPSPSTCNVDGDRVRFAFGNLIPVSCCP